MKLETDVEPPVVEIEEVENQNKIKILKPVSNNNITKRIEINHSFGRLRATSLAADQVKVRSQDQVIPSQPTHFSHLAAAAAAPPPQP